MHTKTNVVTVGEEITAFNTFPIQWWGEESGFKFGKVFPLVLTGKITKIFKNGKLLVAINEMKNNSSDGLTSMHIVTKDLVYNWK